MARVAIWFGAALAMASASGMDTALAQNPSQPVPFKTKAKVWLDAQGIPQQIETPEQLPAAIREAIGAQIKEWRFEPATVNGEAKSGVPVIVPGGVAWVTSASRAMPKSLTLAAGWPEAGRRTFAGLISR